MTFVEFIDKGSKFLPRITLNRSGGCSFTAGMFHKYKLNDFVGVKLYFDAAEKKIGIKLVKEKAEGVFKLSKQAQGKGAYFTAHSFLSSLSIDPKKYAGRYEPEEVNDPEFGKLFVIQLAENAKDTS